MGDDVALIWDCAYFGIVHKYTFKQVRDKVAKLAAVL
jgi:acyl-coenzyme A synthetase/AMP-(fatty) acid ligase